MRPVDAVVVRDSLHPILQVSLAKDPGGPVIYPKGRLFAALHLADEGVRRWLGSCTTKAKHTSTRRTGTFIGR